ncbi:hypothetical protein BT69DRAFT_1342236 [Atractiella rhizophila]|nr:hypothetical protein BT69DRAFT_1342236 [Atractiella rhizophila]
MTYAEINIDHEAGRPDPEGLPAAESAAAFREDKKFSNDLERSVSAKEIEVRQANNDEDGREPTVEEKATLRKVAAGEFDSSTSVECVSQ